MAVLLQKWRDGWKAQPVPFKVLAVLAVLSVMLGILARTYRLGEPDKIVFDEVYFPVFAWNYLHGVQSFDAHPPFGKFIIAVALAVFGNRSFAWRLMPSLFGIGLIFLVGYLWWKYQRDRAGAIMLMLIVALEGIFITYSRTGLMDGVLVFFVLLTFLLSLSATTPRRLFWLGTVLGLAVAIKWVALGVIVPVGFVLMRKEVNGVRFALMFIWAVFVYLAIILAGNLIGRVAHPFNYIWEWQYQAFFYHWDLTVGHPWGSRWYTWPFMIRPVLFAYDPDKAGQVSLISAIGNPLVWWSSTIAVLYSLREVLIERLVRGRRILDHPLVPLLLGYAAFLLPWVGISRVQFIYHYLCAYGFALLILTYWLSRVWRKRPWLVVGYLVLVVAVAVFFLPLQIYWPISLHWLHYHIWLKSWL